MKLSTRHTPSYLKYQIKLKSKSNEKYKLWINETVNKVMYGNLCKFKKKLGWNLIFYSLVIFLLSSHFLFPSDVLITSPLFNHLPIFVFCPHFLSPLHSFPLILSLLINNKFLWSIHIQMIADTYTCEIFYMLLFVRRINRLVVLIRYISAQCYRCIITDKVHSSAFTNLLRLL